MNGMHLYIFINNYMQREMTLFYPQDDINTTVKILTTLRMHPKPKYFYYLNICLSAWWAWGGWWTAGAGTGVLTPGMVATVLTHHLQTL
jgi:hypothetical protein